MTVQTASAPQLVLGIAAYADAFPDRVAVVDRERSLTYASLNDRVGRLAAAYRQRGVGAGDCVGVALRNRAAFLESVAAAARVGAEVVPVCWRAKEGEYRYVVEDAHASLVVAEPEAAGFTDGFSTLFFGDEYDAAATTGEPLPASPGGEVPTFRFYTSGTTGRPKGVLRKTPGPAPAPLDAPMQVHLVPGPLYHAAPCHMAAMALVSGHQVVVMERFDAEECLRLIDNHRVTHMQTAPIQFVRILGLGDEVIGRYDLSSIQLVMHAGAACPVSVKWRIMDVFPPETVYEYYASTEGAGTFISPQEWRKKPGSVGKPLPGMPVKILDEDGNELPAGEPGIVYRGVVDALGRFEYAGAPEKTAEAWRGDLFTVGDIGYLDEDGYLFLVDRAHSVINSGGANVYPAEVEAVLHEHPAVADVAVLGMPDEEWGEVVVALVEATGEVAADELSAFCRDRLSHYKCPRRVHLVDRLPRDEMGKIRRPELRDALRSGGPGAALFAAGVEH